MNNNKTYNYKGFTIILNNRAFIIHYNSKTYSFNEISEAREYIDKEIKPNYCGDYGCKNCQFHKVYYSHDYFSPDEHECDISKNAKPKFELSDDELEQTFDRVWAYGEEWDRSWEQICPYYKEHIDENYF